MSHIATIPRLPAQSSVDSLLAILGSRTFQLMTLLTYAFLLNREGIRVPSGNELVYLLYVYKAWHPHFMGSDWTFVEPTAGHGFFNWTWGWLTLLMPLEWAAWVGRFTCWTLAFIGLFRLGEHFKITSWKVWLGILLWMMQRQALPTTAWTEWMIGSLEAKCPAYICLIFALDAALRRRIAQAGLLAGLAFSFHSAVGMWGGAAIGWAIVSHLPIHQFLRYSICAIATALPGFISSLPLIAGPHAIGPDEARFLVTQALPLCLDPFVMARAYVLLLVLMLGFSVVFRQQTGTAAASMLLQFHLALAVFFGFAFVARAMGRFDLVKLYPARVFAVFALLLFFWQLLSVLSRVLKDRKKSPPMLLAAAVFGVVIFLSLPSPVGRMAGSLATHFHSIQFNQGADAMAADASLESTVDFRESAKWIANNTPTDALVIAPPWRTDAFYFMRRPLIANWHAYRYDNMTEWRSRIESMVGDLSALNPDDPDVGDMDLAARSHYRGLSVADISNLQRRFHASWLLTTSEYPYPLRFSSGSFRVYQLP